MNDDSQQTPPRTGFRIAHVLFLDAVGYSQETTTTQVRLLAQLNAAVTGTAAFTESRSRHAVLPIPTGDGMALLFESDDVTAPARCAVEVTRALCIAGGAGTPSPLAVRIGIHSGLVHRQLDIAGNENVVGEGINTAQRVMDFGDAGHILLSAQYAGWLQQFDEWASRIQPVGEGVAKHGLRVPLFSLHIANDFGNATTPTKLSAAAAAPFVSSSGSGTGQKIVLLYKRNAQPDENVLLFVEERLRAEGFAVAVDRHARIGVDWAREAEKRIRDADAVVAIVSPRSLQSEMLEYELEIVHDQAQRTGKPMLLPIQIGLSGTEIEGPIAAIIAPLNQFHWQGPEDNHRLAAEVLSAIREPLKAHAAEVRLEPVGGAVPPNSPFYVERACDHELMNALQAQESILLIKGARQMGKTSLEARAIQRVKTLGWRCAVTDFQKLNSAQMASEELFYKLLAATLARQLGFKYDFTNEWDDLFGPNLNMETFLRELLDAAEEPLVWCMDEVDKLFLAPFASDFFGLVRSWHNSRSTETDGPWNKLTVAIAYATEAHLFIQDLNQSPFNVGRRLDLEDFNLQQLVDLNGRYGGPLKTYQQVESLHALIGGQPFLSRSALDVLATGKWDFAGLMETADRDDGPFSEHLKRIFVSVSRLPAVVAYVQAVLSGQATPISDQESFYRLLAAGVIKQNSGGRVVFRCDLYRRYLHTHLHTETA